jgi:SPX domain protein involved in polyphosphate accumulation
VSISPVSPLLLQRYELKYLISPDLIEPISRFIEGHCVMDYYSQIAPENSYTINSLYFDNFSNHLLRRKIAGLDNTWNMRVRSYGTEPQAPFFTEVKLKKNDFSNKMRAKVGANWSEILQSGEVPDDCDPRSRQYLEQFIFLMQKDGCYPRILTQYRRKAYLSEIDGYARVTFDRDLRYQYSDGIYNVIPDDRLMCNYDIDEIYPHPEETVILELKCERQIPYWFRQLIQKFELTRRGFSKYGSSILEVLQPKAPEFPSPRDLQPRFNHAELLKP